ncbi:hypothetical protein GCM10009631_15500 [Corynebacterium glaucum]
MTRRAPVDADVSWGGGGVVKQKCGSCTTDHLGLFDDFDFPAADRELGGGGESVRPGSYDDGAG